MAAEPWRVLVALPWRGRGAAPLRARKSVGEDKGAREREIDKWDRLTGGTHGQLLL